MHMTGPGKNRVRHNHALRGYCYVVSVTKNLKPSGTKESVLGEPRLLLCNVGSKCYVGRGGTSLGEDPFWGNIPLECKP